MVLDEDLRFGVVQDQGIVLRSPCSTHEAQITREGHPQAPMVRRTRTERGGASGNTAWALGAGVAIPRFPNEHWWNIRARFHLTKRNFMRGLHRHRNFAAG
ncbi:hypothetical protein K469DRAFT_701845 [Zopfia rhizophila CBS 207.26]|uniref:Uncharacterized protein n=1 Tax=Zopfia rhizophila CBS 207.26 TaxID=1314779 RepID=A0A6A6EBJ8_9PEZI|nr:hypothetical protein K469DRAFT_701845 [Zopfia rhizophila CBS 207.26]